MAHRAQHAGHPSLRGHGAQTLASSPQDRYTALKSGLPGIATNLLADRLRELERAGLARREEAGPPVATTLFQLTDAGNELQPVLEALCGWGIRYMSEPDDSDEFRSHWFALPASLFLHDRDPGGEPVTIELQAADRPAVIEVSGGTVRTRLGSTPAPDAVLRGTPPLIMATLTGHLTLDEAAGRGLEITGDPAVLARLLPGR
jgi:DNA-binding HxlR family transcriptional regulator